MVPLKDLVLTITASLGGVALSFTSFKAALPSPHPKFLASMQIGEMIGAATQVGHSSRNECLQMLGVNLRRAFSYLEGALIRKETTFVAGAQSRNIGCSKVTRAEGTDNARSVLGR